MNYLSSVKSFFLNLVVLSALFVPTVSKAQNDHKFSQFLGDQNVDIPDPFSPFGNTLAVSKFGDDGSSVITDLSGVLIWIDSDGVARTIPGSEQASPLYVSNSEVIIWTNSFADFDTYSERPNVQLTLIRLNADGDPVGTPINIEGKEIVGTPQVTSTTGSFTLLTTERTLGARERVSGSIVDFYDDMTIRAYRVTFSGAVQRIGTYNDKTPYDADEFADTQTGPDVEALGFGSDGSVFLRYKATVNGNFDDADSGATEADVFLWINSLGVSKALTALDVIPFNSQFTVDGLTEVSRVVFVSNNRIVLEETAGADELSDFRRDGFNDQVSGPTPIAISGSVLAFPNYTVLGDDKYFYTLDGTDVNTFKLQDGTANLEGTADASGLPSALSPDAQAAVINPADGSAIITDSSQLQLVWLDGAGDLKAIPDSAQAAPIYTTNGECVIWENARAPIVGGIPEPVVIVHYDFATLTRSLVNIEGSYVIDTSQYTPDFAFWLVSTAEKVAGDTARLRAYRLQDANTVDFDADGLTDAEELDIGTDPGDPDTDNDGLLDGEEANPFFIVDGQFTWAQARIDALSKGGDLASIVTAPDVDRVKSAIGNPLVRRLWIGANDIATEGTFEWVNEEPFVFTNFAAFQPDNLGDADGLELRNNHEWGDADVTERKGYVLELPATNPLNDDSDEDGLSDSAEFALGTDPNDEDTDDDGLWDGVETGTGLFADITNTGTDPLDEDSDDDGINDGDEVSGVGPWGPTDPNKADTDGDGVSDFDEINGDPDNDNVISDPNDPDDPNDGGGGGGGGPGGTDANPDHCNPEFLKEQDVNIPDGFTPFGNSLTVTKYGDDGSSLIVDLSGVIVWADADGNFRRLPDTEFASPLYVTNNEALVWQNRYGDFENYVERPTVELVLYRLDAQGEVVATPITTLLGKEIVDTPALTTSTGSFVIATTERTEGARQRDAANVIVDFYDDATIRFYRITFSGAIQRIQTLRDKIPYETEDFNDTQEGPDVEPLAYGSDGSVFFRYSNTDGKGGFIFDDNSFFISEPIIVTQYVWLNSLGNEQYVPIEALSRAVSVTNTRLVIEQEAGDGLLDYRRIGSTGDQLSVPQPINVEGVVLDSINITRVGLSNYFYTLLGNTVRTYLLTDSGADEIRTSDLPDTLSPGAKVGPVNPRDGSAIIRDENQQCLLWIHDNLPGVLGSEGGPANPAGTGTFTRIKYSRYARALYVTNNEVVLWENADAPIPEGGTPDPAVLVHHTQDPDNGGQEDLDEAPYEENPLDCENTNRKLITSIDGTYVIDAPPFTPGFENWFVITAEKVSAATARLRVYRLRSASFVDTDNDGLSDIQEELIGTDPADPDTDDDGLLDGQEVNPYYKVEGAFNWNAAVIDAQQRGGHAAVITSEDELNRLRQAIGSGLDVRCWLGGNDIALEGGYQWVTGETFFPIDPVTSYAFFAVGQPDNQNDSDGIELLQDFKFNDARIDELKGYVLELPVTEPLDDDTDNDGLKDGAEVNTYGTDPTDEDTDNDGYDDFEEVSNGTDPLDVNDPKFKDSDGDGLTDEEELYSCFTDRFRADTDGDGIDDGDEKNVHGTDPLDPDTDNDGITDGDEVNVLGTDPLVDDFGGVEPVDLVDFSSSLVNGKYYGLITEEDGSAVGYIELKVSKKGSFSGKLTGIKGSKSKLKGTMDALGRYSGQQYNAFGLISNAELLIEEAGSGYHRVGGTLRSLDGRKQYFSLRRELYGKTSSTSLAGAYTMLLPSTTTTSATLPAGDGNAYGSVSSKGGLKFKGYSNTGGKLSNKGIIVEGDQVPFFALVKSSGSEAVAGVVRFRDIAGVSDFDGVMRYFKNPSSSGVYGAGFDQSLSAIGSRYSPSGFALVAVDNFDATPNNSLASIAGGPLGGTSYVFTWDPKGSMTAPKVPTFSTKGKIKNKSGNFSGKYDWFDPDNGFSATKSKFYGVVIQKQNLVSGLVLVSGAQSGRYSIQPNLSGNPAPTTSISPRSKDVPAAASSYIVQIAVDFPWQVKIPADATWVSVDKTSGSGNDQVVITVSENISGLPRDADIKIAGLNHNIEQDWR